MHYSNSVLIKWGCVWDTCWEDVMKARQPVSNSFSENASVTLGAKSITMTGSPNHGFRNARKTTHKEDPRTVHAK